jgi:hypothetical protein
MRKVTGGAALGGWLVHQVALNLPKADAPA